MLKIMIKLLIPLVLLASTTFANELYEIVVEPVDCRVTLSVSPISSEQKGESISFKGINESTTKDITSMVYGYESGFKVNAQVYADKFGARAKIKILKNKNVVAESSYADFPSGANFVGGIRSNMFLLCLK